MDDSTSTETQSAVEEPVGSSIERNSVLWLTTSPMASTTSRTKC